MPALVVETLTLDNRNLRPRFMKKNKVNRFNITADSADGFCTKPTANKVGLADLYVSQTLSGVLGTTEAEYTISIDSTTAGTSVGAATYRVGMQYSDVSGMTYTAFSVPTTTNSTTLNGDVRFVWAAGSTNPDFIVGDRWTFQSRFPNGPAAASIYHRDMKFYGPPGQTVNTIVVDLSASQDNTVNTLAILDHNFGPGTTITYTVGDKTHSVEGDPGGKNILYFENTTQPLHTITIDATGDSISQHEIGYLYLGEKFEFSDRRRDVKYTLLFDALGDYGQTLARFTDYTKKVYSLTFPLVEGVSSNTDAENYMAFRDELVKSQSYEEPLLFHPNPTDTREFGLYFFDDDGFVRDNIYLNLFNLTLDFHEVPKEVHS